MQTVQASVILDDMYQLMGWDQTQLETRQKQQARMALSLALQELWERWWWEELMDCVQVQFQPTYTPGRYFPGTFVYYPQTDSYYQCIQYGIDVDPTDASNNLNAANWIQWNPNLLWQNTTYSGNASNQFGAPGYVYWDPNTSFNLGDIVQYAALQNNNPPTVLAVFVSTIAANQGNTPQLYGGVDSEFAVSWGQVVPWQPNLETDPASPVYGAVRSVSAYDPRQQTAIQPYRFDKNGNVFGLSVGRPWVWSRRVTPVISGDAYDATAAYDATDPQDVVFS